MAGNGLNVFFLTTARLPPTAPEINVLRRARMSMSTEQLVWKPGSPSLTAWLIKSCINSTPWRRKRLRS